LVSRCRGEKVVARFGLGGAVVLVVACKRSRGEEIKAQTNKPKKKQKNETYKTTKKKATNKNY